MSSNLVTLQESVLGVWASLLLALPKLLTAIVIFVVGILIAVALSRAILKIVDLLHLDELAAKFELKQSFERLGIRLHIGALLAWIVKWFFVIVALIAATDILGWEQLTDYLKQIVLFIPNVIIAVIILLAGILLSNFVQRIVKSAVAAAHLSSADFLSGLAKWAILLFSFMAALVQLQIAPALINTLFTGLVAMLALAGGLAFGLGGRDHAARFLDKLRKDISSDR
jgi:hypothetical protein